METIRRSPGRYAIATDLRDSRLGPGAIFSGARPALMGLEAQRDADRTSFE